MAFVTTRRVEFRDTDAAGIVHFSAFFPMMEAAEHAMLRSLGLAVMQPHRDGGHLTWPRVAAGCDYLGAARFEDVLQITVSVAKLGTKSVGYRFRIERDGDPIASGTMSAVCCRLSAEGQLTSLPIPAAIRSLLETMRDPDEAPPLPNDPRGR